MKKKMFITKYAHTVGLVSGSQTFLMIFRFSFDYVAAVAANMQCA